MNTKIRAHIALFIANLIYAFNYTFAKDVMPEYIQPSGFILLRVIGAIVLFGLSYTFFIRQKIEYKDIYRFAICGLFGVAINQLLFFEGLNLTTPINAAIIMTSNPILVIILSSIILHEKITGLKIAGIFLGFIGAATLILNNGGVNLNNNHLIGNICILINATSYGLYLVLVKPLMQKYNPITVMFMVFFFGLLFVLPFGFQELQLVSWHLMPKRILWQVLFVVVCTTFIAYLFNSSALSQLNPSTVSTYIYIQPLLATFIAIWLQSDTLDNTKIGASILIFIGVYLVSIQKKTARTHNLS